MYPAQNIDDMYYDGDKGVEGGDEAGMEENDGNNGNGDDDDDDDEDHQDPYDERCFPGGQFDQDNYIEESQADPFANQFELEAPQGIFFIS